MHLSFVRMFDIGYGLIYITKRQLRRLLTLILYMILKYFPHFIVPKMGK